MTLMIDYDRMTYIRTYVDLTQIIRIIFSLNLAHRWPRPKF